jgi:hypothetical protein
VKIIVTPRELMDASRWDQACELVGLSSWAVNEGQMDSDEEITLTAEQATELGLIDVKEQKQ